MQNSDLPTEPQKRHARSSGRVTLADVARAAGVSPITVSRALRGERAVAPDLIARVAMAATQLGYVPDPAARALASSRSSHVAVLIPMLSNILFVQLLDALHGCLVAAGYQTMIGVTHYDLAEEEAVLRSFLLHRPAGLIVTGIDSSPQSKRLIAESAAPCVHVMESEADPGKYCVGFSQTKAGRALTQMLLDSGRRRIAFVGAQLDPRTLQRAAGYRAAIQAAGLEVREWMQASPSSMALGASMFQQILGETPEVDAIFFCNDDLAQGALLAALRLGVAVPKRVAIAGFNDLPGSDQTFPTLSTVRTPRAAIGIEAARTLIALMNGQPVAQAQVDLGFEVVRRGST